MYYYHSPNGSKVFRILVNFLIISIIFETVAIYEYLNERNSEKPQVFIAKDFQYKPLIDVSSDNFKLVSQNDVIMLSETKDTFNIPMTVDHSLYSKIANVIGKKENLPEKIKDVVSGEEIKIAKDDNKKFPKGIAFKITPVEAQNENANREIAFQKIDYVVKKGDTLWTIAKKYGITPQELAKQNKMALNSTLSVGQKLTIVTNRGFIYKVKKGDTLWNIGKTFNINYKVLAFYNNLKSYNLKKGDKIIIPWTKETAEQKYKLYLQNSLSFRWPVIGRISSPFGYRFHPLYHRRIFHTGIDIAVAYKPIRAALSGTVSYAGWMRGYGKIIIIKHKKGYSTRYAHLSQMKVKQGDKVVRGQIIGVSGNTGKTTGPHLHFEVRRYGKLVNPLKVLPR